MPGDENERLIVMATLDAEGKSYASFLLGKRKTRRSKYDQLARVSMRIGDGIIRQHG
jgi:hypothetical protein